MCVPLYMYCRLMLIAKFLFRMANALKVEVESRKRERMNEKRRKKKLTTK